MFEDNCCQYLCCNIANYISACRFQLLYYFRGKVTDACSWVLELIRNYLTSHQLNMCKIKYLTFINHERVIVMHFQLYFLFLFINFESVNWNGNRFLWGLIFKGYEWMISPMLLLIIKRRQEKTSYGMNYWMNETPTGHIRDQKQFCQIQY